MRRAALLALAIFAAAAPIAPAAGSIPHIRQFEYSEDYEGIGHRHNMSATIKGEADSVRARSGSVSAKGKLSNVNDTDPRGDVWYFRKHSFVKAVKADLHDDGFATVIVKATNGAIKRKKVCELEFEPDPQFGDYAGGDCDKV